jgi:hypothetical protein
MKTTLKINCSTDQLSQILSGYCDRWLSENEKPAASRGGDRQRVSERRSEGSSDMNGKRVALSETSNLSITRLTKEVNERSNNARK